MLTRWVMDKPLCYFSHILRNLLLRFLFILIQITHYNALTTNNNAKCVKTTHCPKILVYKSGYNVFPINIKLFSMKLPFFWAILSNDCWGLIFESTPSNRWKFDSEVSICRYQKMTKTSQIKSIRWSNNIASQTPLIIYFTHRK